jgi:hypothetical protein
MIIGIADNMAEYPKGILEMPMCRKLDNAKWCTIGIHQYRVYIMFYKFYNVMYIFSLDFGPAFNLLPTFFIEI